MQVWLYAGFVAVVLVILAIDLFVVNREDKPVSTTAALVFTAFTVLLASAFTVAIYFMYESQWLGLGAADPALEREAIGGKQAAMEFFSGYLIEYSLSLDNIFVIALIFSHFRIPQRYQHRVLFWGVLGALVMRGVMIAAGTAILAQFEWVIYLFGAFLIFTGVKMLLAKEPTEEQPVPLPAPGSDAAAPETAHPTADAAAALKSDRVGSGGSAAGAATPEATPDPAGGGRVAGFVRRFFRVTDTYDGHRFTTRIDGRLFLTPLGLALIVVEFTDVIFAVDSIPAIFGITLDPFIVFTSNVFAILGLRSLYFALSGMLGMFRYLKYSLAVVLIFVGVKMFVEVFHVKLPPTISLGVIASLLAAGVFGSLLFPPRALPRAASPPQH